MDAPCNDDNDTERARLDALLADLQPEHFAVSLGEGEGIVGLKTGESADVGAYTVTFLSGTPLRGPNYNGRAGGFLVKEGDREITTLVSEKRNFQPSGMPTTGVGLLQTLLGDVYVVMGDETTDGARAMRMYYDPLVKFMWLGAFIMYVGVLLTLTRGRCRG